MKQLKQLLTIIALLITAAVNAQSILNVKVFFQGFYDPNTQTMRAVIDPLNNPAQFDNVTVKLADATNGAIQFSGQAIADVNGNVQLNVPSALDGNSFYIVINHRNCIETWSSNPIVMNNGTSYDFSTSQSAAYGANMFWYTNMACVYSGDVNQDDVVDVFDYLIFDTCFQASLYDYYLTSDMNGDSAVDIIDYLILTQNVQDGVGAIMPFITSISDEQVKPLMVIYPNPTTSDLYIKSEKYNDQWINIYDINGQVLFSDLKNSELIHIDVSNWTSGLYILVTESGEEMKFQVIH